MIGVEEGLGVLRRLNVNGRAYVWPDVSDPSFALATPAHDPPLAG
jgi:hypothetical protein